jgi:hypothetical protein
MPDPKPMSEEMIRGYNSHRLIHGKRPGNMAGYLVNEVHRLKEREEVLAGHLKWALDMLLPKGFQPAKGRLRCALCGIEQGDAHTPDCSYRQAREALEAKE